MNASEYRRICASPDVLSRGTIEATHREVAELAPVLAAKVRNILADNPIPKPSHHEAGSHSDFFRVSLPYPDVEAIVDSLGDREAQLVIAEDLRAQMVADLLDRWNRLAQH